MSGEAKAISLRFELGELRAAVEGARMLADLSRFQSASDAYDDRAAPEATSAILALVEARMRLLGLVIAGELNARCVLAHHNQLTGVSDDRQQEDILITLDGPGDEAEADDGGYDAS